MRFVMVHAHERLAQGERESLSGLEPNHQGVRQTRPLRGGHGVELACGDLSGLERGLRHRHPIPQMLPRRQLRNYAAILGVQLDLRRDDIGEHPPIADDCRAGFIAGRFDGEEDHETEG